MTIDILIFHFFLFAIFGWFIEFIYRSLRYGKLVNPGFNYGPYVPIYGAGAVVLIITYHLVSGQNVYFRAGVYFLVTTVLEYITGETLLYFFKKRYWDYRENFKNFRGMICPSFSLAWIGGAFVFELVLHPLASLVTAEMGLLEIRIFNVLLLYTLTLDFIYSSGLLQRAREVREKSALVFRGRLKPALASLGVRIELPPLDAARKRFAAIRYELPAAMGLFRRYRFYLDELKRRGIVRWRMK